MICVYVCVCMCECQPSFALRHDGKTNRPLIHLSPNCSGFNQEVSRSKTYAGEDSNPEMGQIQSTCKRTCEQVTICIRTWLFGLFVFFDDAVSSVFVSPAAELWCVTGGPTFHFVLPKLLSWGGEEKLQLLAWTWKTFPYFFFSFALERDSAQDCGWSLVDVLLGKTSVSVRAKAAETSHTSNCS